MTTDNTFDAEPTFQPWYHHVPLIIPRDARSHEDRALRRFARQCRADRIKNNIALAPSVPMFAWPDESRAA